MSRWTDYDAPGIAAKVFLCREGHSELSIHSYSDIISADSGLAYWNHDWRIQSGDKPGLCLIDDSDFEALDLPKPLFEKDDEDKVFGHLHYVIRPCLTDVEAAQLAVAASKRANRQGLLRELESARKGVKPYPRSNST